MKLTIGKRFNNIVPTLEECSRIYCRLRDASGEGASSFPVGRIMDGARRYHISYNGRVWEGKPEDWSDLKEPILEAQYDR